MKRFPAFILTLGMAAAAPPSQAGVTNMDVQVAARALSFMETPPSGVVRVGILYSEDSPRSVQQANEILRLIGDGMRAGKMELRPRLVGLGEAATADVELFFLTEFVGGAAAEAVTHAAERPCVTTDMRQVESGACLMGVRSQPKVEIVVNRAAAEKAGVSFATIFRVMITEI